MTVIRHVPATAALCALFLLPAVVTAQTGPPVQGTVALEGTMSKFYDGAQTLIVTTIDGVRHVYRLAKGLVVHTPDGPSGLESLREGSHVAVHYTVDPAGPTAQEVDWIDEDGLAVTEGVVLDINNRKREIKLRLPGGRVETLRLTNQAASGELVLGAGAEVRVVVYYTSENHVKVVHYFKRK